MSSKNRKRAMSLGYHQDDLCFFCNGPLVYHDPYKTYEEFSVPNADQNDLSASRAHYMPRGEGGGSSRENTVIVHRVCNTKDTSRFTPELVEKLRVLNIRRGFGDANGNVSQAAVVNMLRPSTFGPPTDALQYLCDMANAIEGDEGISLRRAISRRLLEHMGLIKDLSCLDKSLMEEALLTIRAYRNEKYHIKLPDKIETLLDNVRSTWAKRALGYGRNV